MQDGRYVHVEFERMVSRHPAAPAVKHPDATRAYDDLNARANRLARHLRDLGVGPERLVAVCMERTPDLLIAVLAVLKAGGAFLPLDPTHPAERIFGIVEDAAPVLALGSGRGRDALIRAMAGRDAGEGPRILDAAADTADWAGYAAHDLTPQETGLYPEHPAYVIYTSGSTGRPKGVVIEHRQLTATAAAWRSVYRLRPGLVILQMASAAFDVFVADLFRALAFGGTLVLCPRDALGDGAALFGLLREHSVGFADFVPAVLEGLIAHAERAGESLSFMDTVVSGADVLPVRSARRLRMLCGPGVRICNTYGLTETAIENTFYEVGPALAEDLRSLPIGGIFPGQYAYLLDSGMHPVADGEVGELYIGGPCVARGYLNRARMTAERFLPDPFRGEPGARMYRTGDLARRLPGGDLEYLGRNDFQVKIRGLRVELGEIEAVLAAQPGVREAVAMVREDSPGQPRLVGYYLADAPHEDDIMRAALRARLPEHMTPQAYVWMSAWPLSANGKLDRKALPAPDPQATSARDFAPPEGTIETALGALWTQLLGLDCVGRNERFLDLGGDSLKLSQLASRIREEFRCRVPVDVLFRAGSLAGMAAEIATCAAAERTGTDEALASFDEWLAGDTAADAPASYQQQSLWLLEQVSSTALAYNSQNLFFIRGEVDPVRMQCALDDLVARHEILRTTFHADGDGRLCQRVHPRATATLVYRELDCEWDDGAFMHMLEDEVQRPFALTKLPLVRWVLIKRRQREYALIHVEHHYVHDGWTANLSLREALELYDARGGHRAALPPPPAQYRDYARWQHSAGSEVLYRKQIEYWRRKLAGAPQSLLLRADFPRPKLPSYRGELIASELSPALVRKLEAFARAGGATPYAVLLSVFEMLIGKYCASEDFLIGSAMANRKSRKTEGMLGMFVNMVVVRCELAGDPSFREFAGRVMATLAEAYEHEETPFQHVVRELQTERKLGENPLFQIAFNYHNSDLPALERAEFEMKPIDAFNNRTSKFDLDVIMVPRGSERKDTITLFWTYATELFRRETLERLIAGYLHLLEQCVTSPDLRLSELQVLPEPERARLAEGGYRAVDDDLNVPVHVRFEEHAWARPEAVAAHCAGCELRYGELDAAANRLADRLRSEGVGPGTRVGLCQQRSLNLIVSILAVLKAGGAYLPLDPAYPSERLRFMLDDARPPVVLTDAGSAPALTTALSGVEGAPPRVIDAEAVVATAAHAPRVATAVAPTAPAYVIYTSGSTGQPKGVLVAHRGLSNLMRVQRELFGVDARSRVLQFASISFDACVFEWVMALGHGGSLRIAPPGLMLVGDALEAFVREQAVTHALLPPAVLMAMPETAALASVEVLISGGEAMPPGLVRRWGEGRRLFNAYGPTEDTVVSTVHACEPADGARETVPIGRALPNHRVLILDARRNVVPVGVVGELYVGGAGVALEYLNRPELTAERFVDDPFHAGERLYKTGDLGRWLADGTIEYLGRNDFQVKIRGFRIELGEIEAKLAAIEGVRESVVLARSDASGQARLLAYYISDSVLDAGGIRETLGRQLPEYMVPAAYVRLERWPLTANGKLDRDGLPEPEGAAYAAAVYVAPRTPIEEALSGIWSKLLGVERVGMRDNFFALGGHSVLGIRLMAEVEAIFGVEVPLRELFENATIEQFVEMLLDRLLIEVG